MIDPERLFAANHQRLFRYFCRAAGFVDAARDLTQEVFVRVSRARVPTAPEGELKAWLFRIARNLLLDHHRHGLFRAIRGQLESRDGAAGVTFSTGPLK